MHDSMDGIGRARLELAVDDSMDGIGRARLELAVEKSNYRAVAEACFAGNG